MDFFFLIVFLAIYYIRPHEWIDWVGAVRPVTLVIVLAIASLFLRERGIRLSQILRTPHDRLMILYLFWIGISSNDFWTAISQAYHLFIFYFLVVLVIDDRERLRSFLRWWTSMIFGIAFLAWASEVGFDPTGSHYLTHGTRLEGRLALNTSLFNNPNALGHSVVPLLGMLYLLFFWKRNFFAKLFGTLVGILPTYVIFLTQSKGTYISGYVMMLSVLTLRRSMVMKVGIIAAMLTIGTAGMMYLPRMEDLRRQKDHREEGIEGRLAAWAHALACLQNYQILGFNRFPVSFMNTHGYHKPSHSSYVQIGAELSYPGLFFFVGLIYFSFRTLHDLKPKTVEMERLRRILFVLLVAYAASSWTVDFAYRATFFMLIGCIAALHRLHIKETIVLESGAVTIEPAKESNTKPLFEKIRFMEYPIVALLTYLTVRMWVFLQNWI